MQGEMLPFFLQMLTSEEALSRGPLNRATAVIYHSLLLHIFILRKKNPNEPVILTKNIRTI
jgi:hypothetical protein